VQHCGRTRRFLGRRSGKPDYSVRRKNPLLGVICRPVAAAAVEAACLAVGARLGGPDSCSGVDAQPGLDD